MKLPFLTCRKSDLLSNGFIRRFRVTLGSGSAGWSDATRSQPEPTAGPQRQLQLQHRHAFPELLPNPNPAFRNSLREKLERADMLQRRHVLHLPEFYVGSVLAVSVADGDAAGKTNRFVGICIERSGAGLRSEFTLRNVINHQGVEVRYELYDPGIQRVSVLRLARRLDPHLRYLRDALPHYCTFPLDMEPEMRALGAVPLDTTQVELKPRPWLERWERQGLRGVANLERLLTHKMRARRDRVAEPWRKYDLMDSYRNTIPEEQQLEIWSQVHSQLQALQRTTRHLARNKTFRLPADKLA